MAHLALNSKKVERCRELAENISQPVESIIATHSTLAIERAVLRLLGVDGAVVQKGGQGFPEVNAIIDQLSGADQSPISRGVLYWFVNAMIQKKMTAAEAGRAAAGGKINLLKLPVAPEAEIRKKAEELCRKAISDLVASRDRRDSLRRELGDKFDPEGKSGPIIYVIVATGNIFEDVIQAKAAAQAGADAIAVIRSTAQSLLDYIPHGATTEGFGGTYATQENFRIMREALDEESKKLGRYIRLTNYCSGLCMPEIAALGARERLDFLLNDAMYGILFRDINMKRTLIDQHFSRRIIALSKIVIHTGEDNYLTTADAIENGHQVLASQFINERFALNAGMSQNLLGLGHALEMNPEHPNVFLLEIARAQMTRDIFPKSPIKFMPPTRYKCGDIFYSHLMDAMFNFVGVLTGQTIQLLGMPTEAMHTPLLQDRWMSIKNARYIFSGAKDLGAEITYRDGGQIERWAEKVLDETLSHLELIAGKGLFRAIEERAFAEVSRTETGGKGRDGVFMRDPAYLNPFFDQLPL
ncbi:MAG TPA: D-lysine 5,6-aminomutase subunit alpha [Bdellovibrionales bacterium]|nr:MAG: D-lysine 5,6-aminomutase subunit alpha [Bdellovibrionales bacterium GWB1_52_6]OFZ04370.1 MAG: D-lysine 5,6-aminomutase subunit alpha [Bdellovibrionales bacterium GWA1_52_35]OFZ36628.1 MAG: D-lysine 5,6-aminomutase subunit alpha [Bdellovibrionales bacterium GWC1_52_8]HAR44577.1 D-lysine 5,6-aminomutase subunit alpha [Bdellovibrionales bacterium]HCM40774.1 D-lysine 5,6-aminomutase subunit alpha [Bdellovibrionales bacterium]